MEKYKDLVKYCDTKGIKYEIHPLYSDKEFVNPFNGERTRILLGWQMGINNMTGRKGKSEWSWTWFDCFDDELNENSLFIFKHRYSMLNGKTYSGANEWRKVFEMLH